MLNRLNTVRSEIAGDISVFSGIQYNLDELNNALTTMEDTRTKAFENAKKCIDSSKANVNACEDNYNDISIAGNLQIANLRNEITTVINNRIAQETVLNNEITSANNESHEKEVMTATLANMTEEAANTVVNQLGLISNDYQRLLEVRNPAMTAINDFSDQLKIYLGSLSDVLEQHSDEYCKEKENQDNDHEDKSINEESVVCECQQ